jgi:hypothetical protein
MLGETCLRRFNASTRKPAQSSGSCCALGQLSLSALSPAAASFAGHIWASIRNHRAFLAKPARGCGGNVSSSAASSPPILTMRRTKSHRGGRGRLPLRCSQSKLYHLAAASNSYRYRMIALTSLPIAAAIRSRCSFAYVAMTRGVERPLKSALAYTIGLRTLRQHSGAGRRAKSRGTWRSRHRPR